MTEHKLVLIDGHALAYRMFFALPLEAFTTKEGEPTNATYGFTRTLLDLILAPNPPQYLAVSLMSEPPSVMNYLKSTKAHARKCQMS